MTPPVTTEALVEALAQTMWEQSHAFTQKASWNVAQRLAGHLPDGQVALRLTNVRRKAAEIVAKHVAPLLAALHQVTAERDEDRAEHARYRVSAEEMWETAKRHGGRMLAEKHRADTAEAALAAANTELARLRAEGEVKDRALKEIANGETEIFDEGLGCNISAWLNDDEMQDIARTALARAATAREG